MSKFVLGVLKCTTKDDAILASLRPVVAAVASLIGELIIPWTYFRSLELRPEFVIFVINCGVTKLTDNVIMHTVMAIIETSIVVLFCNYQMLELYVKIPTSSCKIDPVTN
jgi:hypothetical protein